ncbi:type II secretion system protein E [Thalassoporum mexicanum PCC 7367]|uniref:GspE/PulE family protein n=1 Tax=Thalassoporum mexicanum TaxID=3457544 RepID=UPI00029FBF03|nr:GspE/PulE family protein [Pseudanabaena sp. PCC 7367]AFY70073.1 type II secretion system protein E [Pseudanabaena sp. PCC 7367]
MNTSGQQKQGSTKNRKALLIRGGRTPFETKLIESGHATSEQYDRALEKSEEDEISLLAALQEVLNQALPPDIARYYKRLRLLELKLLYGFECLDPDIDVEKFNISNISGLIETDVVPMSTCRNHEVLPLVKKDNTLLVGMVSPDNFKAIDDLSMLLSKQELTLQRRVITREDFNDLLEQIIEAQVNKSVKGESFDDEALRIDDDAFADETLGEVDEGDDLSKAIGENSAPVINLVDKILVKALQEGASDIHIEPQEKNLRIRFRRDGVLREVFFLNDDRRLPKSITAAVIARFKIISNLNIAERRVPQDGKLKRVFQKRRVDFRVSTCPSQHGEKVVLRILDNSNTQLGLDKLITDPESLEIMQGMAQRPFGLILVTGPTGSGKTTTLYSALAEVNEPGINISTAEDPVEYNLPGLTQCQVIRAKGMDFALILRAFLRQDPDVILVGETRDQETAKTAIEAALTGHLVLTTLHTNDAPSAIARLEEMGVERFMASTALIGVLAQRLLRRVCDVCRIPYQPTIEDIERFGLPRTDLESTFYKANRLSPQEVIARQESNLSVCKKCGGSGYKGRVGCYEIMRMSENMQVAINKGATTEMIKEIAVQEGMKTLMAYSFELVRTGATTLEEVLRVVYTDKGREAEERAKRQNTLECQNCHAILKPEMIECPYCTTPRII